MTRARLEPNQELNTLSVSPGQQGLPQVFQPPHNCPDALGVGRSFITQRSKSLLKKTCNFVPKGCSVFVDWLNGNASEDSSLFHKNGTLGFLNVDF